MDTEDAAPQGGHLPEDRRRVLDAILWVARTGAPWRDLPAELGNWNSVHKQARLRTISGLGDVLLQSLADSVGEADALQIVDCTIIRAHHCAAGARGIQGQALGCSLCVSSTKIHLRVNFNALPIGIALTPGEAHDLTALRRPDGRARQRCLRAARGQGHGSALSTRPRVRPRRANP